MLHGRIAMLHGRIAMLHGRIAMRPYADFEAIALPSTSPPPKKRPLFWFEGGVLGGAVGYFLVTWWR
jgi:hypothetical protein